jgi:hypothetical protein
MRRPRYVARIFCDVRATSRDRRATVARLEWRFCFLLAPLRVTMCGKLLPNALPALPGANLVPLHLFEVRALVLNPALQLHVLCHPARFLQGHHKVIGLTRPPGTLGDYGRAHACQLTVRAGARGPQPELNQVGPGPGDAQGLLKRVALGVLGQGGVQFDPWQRHQATP